ncbi:hypothetical protein GR11A_00114 [Vibrio phage vB_VcorM_GR11A]|nr:hypothetical protein GR11A_00114 [Vibrio phage vB_VcorM_GR11A]
MELDLASANLVDIVTIRHVSFKKLRELHQKVVAQAQKEREDTNNLLLALSKMLNNIRK